MIDKARIYVRSGNGGKGCISFRREKFVPRGGPDGGNGGKGGDVYIQGNPNYNTLLRFRYNQHFFASNGEGGSGANCTGAYGDDIVIQVPFGTSIYNNNKLLLDILDDTKHLILYGGKGGIGNGILATSTDKAPRRSIPPVEGLEMVLDLQLKLIGHIAFIGLPNAGKSSLLNSFTNAKSEVGNFAFTTLSPQLGTFEDYIFIDLPGIIEGASKGKGLGLLFLSHCERSKVLCVVLDSRTCIKDLHIILNELKNYGINKPLYIAINKIELLKSKTLRYYKKLITQEYKYPIISISVHNNININKLVYNLINVYNKTCDIIKYE